MSTGCSRRCCSASAACGRCALWSRLSGAPAPEVYHTNEGHAGFLGLERIRELVADEGLAFDEALEAVRAATVFTTHTPVPAGHRPVRPRRRSRSYFGGRPPRRRGAASTASCALGAEDYAGGDAGVFNMAVMGLRLAQRANGVSQLHGEVSRGMFDGLWPGFDAAEVPITSITNGVHAPTWVDRRVVELAERHVGGGRRRGAQAGRTSSRCPDGRALGRARASCARSSSHDARRRVRASWLERGATPAELGWVDDVLDPDVLTIGFARRVPTYKRLTLMLRDPRAAAGAAAAPRRGRCSWSSPASRTPPTTAASGSSSRS